MHFSVELLHLVFQARDLGQFHEGLHADSGGEEERSVLDVVWELGGHIDG